MDIEATEIQVFVMITDRKTGDGRLAQRGECVEYYDILVRSDDPYNGETTHIEGYENLTFLEKEDKVAELEKKYGLRAEEIVGF